MFVEEWVIKQIAQQLFEHHMRNSRSGLKWSEVPESSKAGYESDVRFVFEKLEDIRT